MLDVLRKDNHYISLTFSDEDLKIAHLKADGSLYQVVNVVKRDIRGISQEELPSIIKSAINDFNVKRPQAICVIPSNITTTKNIEIPSLDQE